MTAQREIILRTRPLEALAAAQDRLSPLARVHHAHSLAPARIALPPMPIGETFLDRWPVREGPGDASFRADHYMSVAPALFVLRDALVHSSAGLIGLGDAVIEESLSHADPARQSFRRTADGVALRVGRVRRLAGTHITVLAGVYDNYYHAMLEGVMRLALVPPHWLERADTLLLPARSGICGPAIARMGLPLSLGRTPVDDGETLLVETLVYPLSAHGLVAFHPCLAALYQRIGGTVPDGAGPCPTRFYVDRRTGGRRVLLNEDAVIDALRPLGIVPVRPEAMSFDDQVRLFCGADLIVAPHGAGLANIGFCRPGCALLELQMDLYTNWLFRHLAALGGLHYDCVIGRATGAPAALPADAHRLGWTISAAHVAAAAWAIAARVDGVAA